MRVLHINCNYVGTALHRVMLRHLDAAGVASTVFAPVHSAEAARRFRPEPRERVSVCFRRWDRLFFSYKQRKIGRAARQSCPAGEGYDCIHAHTLFTDGNCARALAAEYGVPYVVAVRDTDVNAFFRWRPWLRSRGVAILRDAAAVVFLSGAYREAVLQRYVPASLRAEIAAKAQVIPNGIDDFWLAHPFAARDVQAAAARLQRRELNAVCVGRINRRKNIPALQRALRLLRDAGWQTRLTVIGRVEDQGQYRKILRDEHTACLPPMDKEGLQAQYRRHDVFLLASRTETFGLVYAEAMSQGLPVIYTRGQGFDGQFADGEAGYPVDAGDPGQIAQAVQAVAERYAEIAGRCPDLARKFAWADICARYVELYRQICGGKENDDGGKDRISQ